MTDEQGGQRQSGDPVAELLATAVGLLGEASQVRGWSCSGEELRERVRWAQRVVAAAEGVRLGVLRQVQGRPEVVAGAAADRAAATLLIHGCRVNPWQAARDVAAAEAGDPEGRLLPRLGAALAAGEISRAHLDVATSALSRLPAAVKSVVLSDGQTGLERIDEFLLGYCREHPPATVKQVVAELIHLLRPDGEGVGSDAVARRRLRYRTDPDTGMLSGSFDLDPVAGVEVVAALEALAAPHPNGSARTEDGACEEIVDLRSRPQRLADALTSMAEIALANSTPHHVPDPTAAADAASTASQPGEPAESGESGETAEQRGLRRRYIPDVVVLATWDQLIAAGFALPGSRPPGSHGSGERGAGECGAGECGSGGGLVGAGLAMTAWAGGGDRHGGLLDPVALARLACDGRWRRVLLDPGGVPLDLGRGARLATRAQRIAVTARDGGCVIPGCGMPVSWCDLHHHVGWADGGGTDLDNLYALCGRHHTEVHAGVWSIHWMDGLPWVRPPASFDRARRLMRNTTHEARARARQLGRQVQAELQSRRRPPDWVRPPGEGGSHSAGPASRSCQVRRRDAALTAPRPRRDPRMADRMDTHRVGPHRFEVRLDPLDATRHPATKKSRR